jgi:hypothetical protein
MKRGTRYAPASIVAPNRLVYERFGDERRESGSRVGDVRNGETGEDRPVNRIAIRE